MNRSAYFLSITLVWLAQGLSANAAFVYETPAEFLSTGDFNGDGVADVLVLDRLTGNARIGYQTNGTLTWSSPLPTGIASPDALAVGRFRDTNQDAVALTSSELNRVHLFRLANPTNPPAAAALTPTGLGPNFLVGLSAPFGVSNSFDSLLIGSSANNTNFGVSLLELFGFIADTQATFQDSIAQQAYLGRGNSLRLGADPVTYAAAMQRGSNDTFAIYSPSNHFVLVASRPGLASGSDYVFGRFNGETLPRVLFYVPGQSNLLVHSLVLSNSSYLFDAGFSLALAEPVQSVYYLDRGTDGVAIIRFGDGVQGLTLPSGSPVSTPVYRSGAGASGNTFTGVVPLNGGNFALLDGAAGSGTAAHEQVIHFDGASFSQVSSGNLPALTTRGTRANVWLFQAEPFVTSNPGFSASLNAPDWATSATLAGNSVSALAETDSGPATGLGNATSNYLGALPAGAAFATADQYRDFISLFTYSAPRAPEAVNVSIAPPPGLYGYPIQVSLTPLNPSDRVLYRLAATVNYQLYAAPFTISNDTTVQYYGTNKTTGARSRLYAAAYTFGRAAVQSPLAPLDLAPGTTNPAPPVRTNYVMLSDLGTVFYGRRPPQAGAAVGFLGPTPYLSFANSPFFNTNGFGYFYLETFESGAFSTPGLGITPGWTIAGPGSFTDSVDADDGSLNGSGAGGHSLYSGGNHSLTVTFNAAALGGHLPTHAGIVWTDVGVVSPGTVGRANVLFSATNSQGVSLGQIVGSNLGDGAGSAGTAEDRFFGIVDRDGIASFTMTITNSGDWEVDHIQYGYAPAATLDGSIWAINLDGSGETFITTGARPRVSRDGRYLAFLREGAPFNNQGNLWVRDLTTGLEARLLGPNTNQIGNTNRLVCYDWDLTEANLLFDWNCRFWTIGLAGVPAVLPLNGGLCTAGSPVVSPVDGRVAFDILYPGLLGLSLAPADMTSSVHLNIAAISPCWPAWSPDGQWLAFTDDRDVSPSVDAGRNLWVLQLAPVTNLFQITGFTDNTNFFPHGAVWSPDGDALVGAGTMFGTNGIWVIPLTPDHTDCDGPAYLLPTSPGDPIDFVGSIVAAPALQSVVQPGLFIALHPDAAIVYWSAAYRGFTLESTTDLRAPTSWTPLNGPYDFDGYFYQFREPLAALAQQKFFRLHYTGSPP